MVGIVTGSDLGLETSSRAKLGSAGVVGGASTGGNALHGRGGESVYVNAASGNLIVQQQDEILMGRGPDASVLRTYNSQGVLADDPDAADLWLPGWGRQVHGLYGTLNTAGSTILRRDAHGAQVRYVYDTGQEAYLNNQGEGARDLLRHNAPTNTWTWTEGSTRVQESYAANGSRWRIVSSSDDWGNRLTYTYDEDGRLSRLSTSSGEQIVLEHQDGRLTQVRTVDAQGMIVSTRTRYSYDTQGRLAGVSVDLTPSDNSIADGAVHETRYTYDGTSTRIARITQSDGSELAFEYGEGADGVHRLTRLSEDPQGLNRVTTLTYDLAARATRVRDAGGQDSVLHYDDAGRLLRVQLPAVGGAARSLSYTYDGAGNVTSFTDALGHTRVYGYDANGNRTLERDAQGNTVSRSYGQNLSRLLRESVYRVPDPDGAGRQNPREALTTHHVYDDITFLLERFRVGPDGEVTEYAYDARGQRLRTIEYLDARFDVSSLSATSSPSLWSLKAWAARRDPTRTLLTDDAYDARGQLRTRTRYARVDSRGEGVRDGNESVAGYVYGPRGELLQEIDPRSRPGASVQRTYRYDGLGRLTASVDALGQRTVVSHDDAGRRTLTTYANGRVHSATFDAGGALIHEAHSTPDAAGDIGAGGQSLLLGETRSVYDAAGRLRARVDAAGQVTHFIYDEASRLVGELDPHGVLRETLYDRNDRQVGQVRYANALNATAQAGLLDAQGVPQPVSLASLRPASHALDRREWRLFDAAGRLVKQIDPAGAVLEHRYDGASRRIQSVAFARPVDVAAITLGTLVSDAVVNPTASQEDRYTRYFHDGEGRLTGTLDPEGYLTERRYDPAGQLLQTTAYARPTAADLRASGTLARLRPSAHADDQHTRFTYDAQGRKTGEVDALGLYSAFAYDASGNMIERVRHATPVDAAVFTSRPVALSVQARSFGAPVRLEVRVDGVTVADSPITISSPTLAEHSLTVNLPGGQNHRVDLIFVNAGTDVEVQAIVLDSQRVAASAQEAHFDLGTGVNATNGVGTAAIPGRVSQSGALRFITQAGERVRPATHQDDQRTAYEYDALDRLTRETRPDGLVETRAYDSMGNLAVHTLAAGSEESRITTRRHDLLGRVIAELDGEASAMLATLTRADAIEALWASRATHHHYDAAGRRIASTGPLGQRSVFYYDARGLLTHTINALGEVTEQRHDAFRQVSDTIRYTRRLSAQATAALSGGHAGAAFLEQIAALAGDAVRERQGFDATGRQISLTDALGYVTELGYSAFGQLISRTSALDATRRTRDAFSYDRRGLLLATRTDADGLNLTRTQTYDAFGRVVEESDARGNRTRRSYDRGGRVLEVRDALGGIQTRTYDAFDRVLTLTNALGRRTTYRYDTASRSVQVRSHEGTQSTTTHTRHGEVRSHTDGNGNLTTHTYDGEGRRTGTHSALARTGWVYDAAGRLIESVDSRGTRTVYTYDAAGQLLSETLDPRTDANPAGLALTTRYRHDALGRAVWRQDPAGVWTRTDHDARGQVTGVEVDPRRGPDWTAGQQDDNPAGLALLTTYAFDAQGRTVRITEGAGTSAARTVVYGFDAAGRRIREEVDPEGLKLVTTYAYDADGNVMAKTDAGGTVTRYYHDANNRLRYSVDALGQVTGRTYDQAGQLVQESRYALALQGFADFATLAQLEGALRPGLQDRHERLLYDGDGRLGSRIDALGFVTDYRHDANGNLIQEARYDQAVDLEGIPSLTQTRQALLARRATFRHTRHAYDAADRRVYSVDALGHVSAYRYDASGNLIAQTRHARPVNLAGDVAAADIAAALAPDSAQDRVQRHFHDAANRRVASVDALGYLHSITYDARGNVSSETCHANALTGTLGNGATPRLITQGTPGDGDVLIDATRDARTRHTYDAAGRLIASARRIDARSEAVTTRTLDALGRLRVSTDALGHATHIAYDAAGREVMRVDPEGLVTASAHDASGSRVRESRYANRVVGNVALGQMPRIVQSPPTTSGQSAGTTAATDTMPYVLADAARDAHSTFEYDALGRETRAVDAEGHAQSATWNAFGEKTRFTNKAGGTFTYTYDDLGRKVEETLPVSAPDAQGNPRAVVNRHRYNAHGEKISQTEAATHAEARTTTFVYDVLGRLNEKRHPAVRVYDPVQDRYTDGVQPTEHWAYDAFDNVTRYTDANRNATSSYYDALNRKVAEVSAAGVLSTSARDAQGNVLVQRSYANAVQAGAGAQLSFTQAPEVLSQAPQNADGRVYVIADAANDRAVLFTYDALNRQTGTRIAQITVGAYDAASALYKVSTADLLVATTYDANDNVLSTTDANGNLTRHYYDRAGREVARVDAARYLTVSTRGAAGELLTQTRFANALAADLTLASATTLAQLTGTGVLTPSAQDRSVEYGYDRLQRLVRETHKSVQAGTVSASTGSLSEFTGDAHTTRAYNALGQVTRLTNAVDGVIDSEYDLLGRKVREQGGVFTDAGGNRSRITTETRYNALGLVTRTILKGQHDNDRVSATAHDAAGRAILETDPAGQSTRLDYDAQGNLTRKTLLSIRDAQGNTRDEITRYRYDALNRQTHTHDAGTGLLTEVRHNAFGEIDARRQYVGDTPIDWQESTHYDRAGRAWKSNAQDAITKVHVFDAHGNATLKIDNPGADLGGSTLTEILKLDTNNRSFSVYDARNQPVDTYEPGIAGQSHQVSVRAEQGGQRVFIGNAVAIEIDPPTPSADAIAAVPSGFGGVATLEDYFALQGKSNALTRGSGPVLSWAPVKYETYGYLLALTVEPPRSASDLPGEKYRVVLAYTGANDLRPTEQTHEFGAEVSRFDVPGFRAALGREVSARLYKVSALGELPLGSAWIAPESNINLSVSANQVLGSVTPVTAHAGNNIFQPKTEVVAHDMRLQVHLPHLASTTPGETYRVVLGNIVVDANVRASRTIDYDAALTRLDLPAFRVQQGYTASLSVYKLGAQGQQTHLGTVNLPTTTSFTLALSPNRVLYLHNQPPQTQRLLMAYRPAGDGLWQWLAMQPTRNAAGTQMRGWFEVDLSTFEAADYEFQYFGLGEDGRITTWQSGRFAVNAAGSEQGALSAQQNTPADQRGTGSAFFTGDGWMHILAAGDATRLSVRYRRRDSGEAWSAVDLSNATPAGASVAGWFMLAHRQVFQHSTAYELDITAYREDQVLRRVRATYTRESNGRASVSALSAVSEVVFTQRPDTLHVDLLYRTQAGADFTRVRLQPTAPGSGRFIWDASALLPDRRVKTPVQVQILAYSAEDLLNNHTSTTLVLGPDPSTGTPVSQVIAPTLRLTPPDTGTVSVLAGYRPQGESVAYVPLGATRHSSEFRLSLEGITPPASGNAVYEYYYDALDANGTVLGRHLGTFTLSATAGSAVRLDWVITGVSTTRATLHRAWRYNAFGEVVRETDGLGRVSDLLYNTQGKLIEKRSPETNVTLANGFVQRARPTIRSVHDLTGRLIGSVNANGNLRTQVWRSGDTATDLILERAADGGLTRHRFDYFGDRRFSINAGWSGSGPEAGYVTEYRVDALGRVIEMRQPERLAGSAGNDTSTTLRAVERYGYDGAGRRISHTNALGFTDTTEYDTLGRVIRTSSAQGFVTSYQYTLQGKLTGVGGKQVAGWRKLTTDPVGRTRIEHQDFSGRLTWRQDLGGHAFGYTYNHAGWLTAQSGSSGQKITREYYANGMLKVIWDQVTGAYTHYQYDAAGNRTFEGYVTLRNPADVNGGIRDHHQYAQLEYDELNRLTRVLDPRAEITYEYDAQGNKRRIWSSYHDGVNGARATQEYWYTYDAENRFLITQGSLSGTRASSPTDGTPRIVTGNTGVAIAYDRLGQRVQAANGTDGTLETYRYSADGYLIEVRIDANAADTTPGVLRNRRDTDLAGRVTTYTEYDASGRHPSYTRTSTYDRDNRTLAESGSDGTTTYRYYTDATDNAATASQGGAGALAVSVNTNNATTVSTYSAYEYWDAPREMALTNQAYNPDIGERNARWKPGYARLTYDVNGNLASALDAGADGTQGTADDRTLRYVTDAQGLILNREESSASRVARIHRYYHANGARVGDVGNEGPSRVDYAQALARRGESRDYKNWRPLAGADFDQNYEPVGPTSPGHTPGSYTVRAGDTLSAIAAALWGDRSLWYLLAEANALSGSETLTPGQVLSVPNKLTNVHHNAGTVRVYNPQEAIGDTRPTLPDVPPPPAAKKCGAIVQILLIIVVVVVSIYTAGAATGFLASAGVAGGSAAATTMGVGMAAMSGTAGLAGFAGAMIGAAAGSAVGQGLAMAAGYQDKFSWRQVGASAGGAGITAGMGAALQATGMAGFNGQWGAVAKAAVSSAATQAINVKLGFQEHFSLRSVAAAGAGALVSSYGHDWGAEGQELLGFNENSAASFWTRSLVSNAATTVVKNEVFNRPFNLAEVATEAIGDTAREYVAGHYASADTNNLSSIRNITPVRLASETSGAESWKQYLADATMNDASEPGVQIEGDAVEVTATRIDSDRDSQRMMSRQALETTASQIRESARTAQVKYDKDLASTGRIRLDAQRAATAASASRVDSMGQPLNGRSNYDTFAQFSKIMRATGQDPLGTTIDKFWDWFTYAVPDANQRRTEMRMRLQGDPGYAHIDQMRESPLGALGWTVANLAGASPATQKLWLDVGTAADGFGLAAAGLAGRAPAYTGAKTMPQLNAVRLEQPDGLFSAVARRLIADRVADAIRPHLRTIEALDPNAQVGFRGSLSRGNGTYFGPTAM